MAIDVLKQHIPGIAENGVDITVTFKIDGTEVTATAADLNLIAVIPTSDQEDSSTIWNDSGVLKVSGAGG